MLRALLTLLVIAAIVVLFIKAIFAAPILVVALVVAYFVFRGNSSTRV